jgi:hypothetical protein
LPDVQAANLNALPLKDQVDWWASWSLRVIERFATCAEGKDLWRFWYSNDLPTAPP